jgi:hypothetical protein
MPAECPEEFNGRQKVLLTMMNELTASTPTGIIADNRIKNRIDSDIYISGGIDIDTNIDDGCSSTGDSSRSLLNPSVCMKICMKAQILSHLLVYNKALILLNEYILFFASSSSSSPNLLSLKELHSIRLMMGVSGARAIRIQGRY